MVPVSHVVAFAVAAFVIIVIPGPNVLFAIGRALVYGRGPAFLSVIGATLGSGVPLVAVAVGLGAIVTASALALTIVKIAGALYLGYLGVLAIRERKSLAVALNSTLPEADTCHMVGQGFIVGATNPKTIVFFAAVLPQFADPASGAMPLQFLVLGAIFLAIQVVSDGSWAMLAGTARNWFARSPRRLEAVGSTGGLMIIGVGASVALSSGSH